MSENDKSKIDCFTQWRKSLDFNMLCQLKKQSVLYSIYFWRNFKTSTQIKLVASSWLLLEKILNYNIPAICKEGDLIPYLNSKSKKNLSNNLWMQNLKFKFNTLIKVLNISE